MDFINFPIIFDMTPDQSALYFLIENNSKARLAYNETLLLAFEGTLDIEKLEQAIELLVERHETLRTVFTEDGKSQAITAYSENFLTLHISILPNYAPAEKLELLNKWLKNKADRVLKLTKGPLYYFSLLKYSESFAILAISAVNSLSDGITFYLLARELASLYNDPKQPLAPPMQYRNFVKILHDLMAEKQQHKVYWEKMLLEKPIKRIDLPSSKRRPAIMSFKGRHHQFRIDECIVSDLKTFGKENYLTLFMTLFAVFCFLIHHLTSMDDIIIGIPFAYRQNKEMSSCVGFCITIFPIRITLLETDTLITYFKKVRNIIIN